MRDREAHIGEDIYLGLVEEHGELRELGPQLVGDAPPLQPGGFSIVLRERGADEGGYDTPAALAGMRERVAHEVHAAALPSCVQHLADGALDAFVSIRDDQLDATQPAACELAQECGPEGLGFRWADVHAKDLAPTVA